MKRIDPFILGIIIFTLIALAGGTYFAFKTIGKPLELYSASDTERPRVEVSASLIDLGQMKVEEIKNAEFTLTNIGEKTLQINNISTSCNCTFAQVEIEGQKSPRFSMHESPSWTGEIEPDREAKIIVTYEPALMPVKGKVERSAFMKTNDPQNSELSLKVSATVE